MASSYSLPAGHMHSLSQCGQWPIWRSSAYLRLFFELSELFWGALRTLLCPCIRTSAGGEDGRWRVHPDTNLLKSNAEGPVYLRISDHTPPEALRSAVNAWMPLAAPAPEAWLILAPFSCSCNQKRSCCPEPTWLHFCLALASSWNTLINRTVCLGITCHWWLNRPAYRISHKLNQRIWIAFCTRHVAASPQGFVTIPGHLSVVVIFKIEQKRMPISVYVDRAKRFYS